MTSMCPSRSNTLRRLDQTIHSRSPIGTVADLARSKSELVAENALLRQQLLILRRQVKRLASQNGSDASVLLARTVRTWKQALFIVQPETLLRWHRQGFSWIGSTSPGQLSKPRISPETVALEKARWQGQTERNGSGRIAQAGVRLLRASVRKNRILCMIDQVSCPRGEMRVQ